MQLKNTQVPAVRGKSKILVICGPTATGKTHLALRLAKKFNGELISADSRQVYKRLDIGTGKDVPQDAIWHLVKLRITNYQFSIGYWETKNKTRIWGYDLTDPKEEFSVADYIKIAGKIIDDIVFREKLPILVGGTGLYIKGVIDGILTAIIPKSIDLRNKYRNKTTEGLQNILGDLDLFKLTSMNNSDRNNPRRLVRAIEVAQSKNKYKFMSIVTNNNYDTLIIGLRISNEVLKQRINKRVNERIDKGFLDEVNILLKSGVSWNDQSMNTLGYKHYKKYINGELNMEDFKYKWAGDEYKYAKRQMTWFKKNNKVKWFDISVSNWQREVDNLVNRWYS